MNVARVAVTGPSAQSLYLPVGEASCCAVVAPIRKEWLA